MMGKVDLINVYGKLSGWDAFVLIRMCPWMLGTIYVLLLSFFLSLFVWNIVAWAAFYLLDCRWIFSRSCHVADVYTPFSFPVYIAPTKCQSIENQHARMNQLKYITYIMFASKTARKMCSQLARAFIALFTALFFPRKILKAICIPVSPKGFQDWVDLDVNLTKVEGA